MRRDGSAVRRGALVLCTSCGSELGGDGGERDCECRRPRSHLVEVVMLAARDGAESGRGMRASIRIAAKVLRPRRVRGVA